jgi:hypothetical protein
MVKDSRSNNSKFEANDSNKINQKKQSDPKLISNNKNQVKKSNKTTKIVFIFLGIILFLGIQSCADPHENDASSGYRGFIPALIDLVTYILTFVLMIALLIYGIKKLTSNK